MKMRLKKYIYLINDITNIILKKDREEEAAQAADNVKKLRTALIAAGFLLLVSLIFNVYFLIG
ncbi:MAG: hypothetical protein V1867_05865 [Candidatus Falkowbacteria bacterium]